MRNALTTACEVVGAALVGFAVDARVGIAVLGAAMIGAGIIEGRRS